MINFEKELNSEQFKAVQSTEGPLLILAGAGSGKTRVITYRIAYLIEKRQVRPENILAVTFTNKAAEQMKQRVANLVRSGRTGNPTISTFHSFCVRVLRRDCEALGYRRDFTIYDDADQLSVVKSCLKQLGLDEKQLSPRQVLSQISFSKNQGLTPAQCYQEAFDAKGEQIAVVFEHYEKKLKQANAFDFDDLLLKTVELLDTQPQAAERLNRQYLYVLVDEFQDTNRIQYRLIRQLTRAQQNLCAVGDEDQSIYGWRGADIQNILSFEKDYPAAQIIKLEQNYRSTQCILDAAGAVVANNVARKGKILWTERKGGELVTLQEAADADAEALFVAQRIQWHLRTRPSEPIAVLYRTNFQSRVIEEACRRAGVKYAIVGGFSFYERAEVKDLLAYLKLGLNPTDSVALKRVVNVPPRGIGKTTLDTLEEEAAKRNLSLWETIGVALQQRSFSPRTLSALGAFRQLAEGMAARAIDSPLPELLSWILEQSGYVQALESENTEESLSRKENLAELVNAARESAERGETISDFIDHAALVSDADDYDEKARVTLMTLHCAKGLEFPTVFLAGMEEGLFPHSRSMSSEEEIEEERRLCYVGMTRAEKKLYLSWARYRRILGNASPSVSRVSRFIGEIPESLVESPHHGMQPKVAVPYQGQTYNTAASIQEFYQQRGKQIDLAPAKKPRQPVKARPLVYGSYIKHAQFGVGTLIRCEGEGEEAKLTVSFPGHGVKKIVRKFARLAED